MKKLLSIAALALLAAASLSACTCNKKETSNKQQTDSMEGKKILVAYFSWSGNTKDAAQYIAQKLGADEFEIKREKPYPTEYEPCREEAHAEIGSRPAIVGKVENMEQFDVVFIGLPVWAGTAPMPVFTFLEQYDFAGKTVIPFCTCYTAASRSLRDIAKATPDSDHRDGLTIVTKELAGKDMADKHGQIDDWLAKMGF
ncbi:MAG: hypothetical protein IJG46_01735 [Prevotella sp.]|nr:hypothetical protein [Prevotella sp.]